MKLNHPTKWRIPTQLKILILLLTVFTPFCNIALMPIFGRAQSLPFLPNSSVTYDVNETILYQTSDIYPTSAELWNSGTLNWTSDPSNSSSYIQQSTLLSETKPTNYDNYTTSEDMYNNTYEFINKTFAGFGNPDNQFYYSTDYLVILYSRAWTIPVNITLSNYDKSSWLYNFYTQSLPDCEANDSGIQAVAENLSAGLNSVVDIAKADYMFVIKNLIYVLEPTVLGAVKALKGGQGDCSEFSSLMVALLRASGIPARKVLGLGIVQGDISQRSPLFNPQIGQTFSYNSSTLPGHAWVQYYVPTIGWVTCDPTWGQAYYEVGGESEALNYFDQIDYCHMLTTVGDYYGTAYDPGIYPQIVDTSNKPTGVPEFPLGGYFLYTGTNTFFSFGYSFKVVSTNILTEPPTTIDYTTLFVILGCVAVVIIIIVVGLSPKKKVRPPNEVIYR